MKEKFKEIEEQSNDQKNELQNKIKELTAIPEHSLYRFLKMKFPDRSNAYLEFNLKSKIFKKTETGFKEHKFEACNITGNFDERIFKIATPFLTLLIPFSKVKEWWHDDLQPDKKINLELNMAIVKYEKENEYGKLDLEDFSNIKIS